MLEIGGDGDDTDPALGIHALVLEGEPLNTNLHHRIAVKASLQKATD